MREEVIPDGKGKTYFAFSSGDVERVNPIDHYKIRFMRPRIWVLKRLMLGAKTGLPEVEIDKAVSKDAEKNWAEEIKKTNKIEIPTNFLTLLTSKSKKDQVSLLKG